MSLLSDIIEHNQHFVESKDYEQFKTTKFPDKRMVVITCMDTRLSDLLPRALNLRNGDAKIIKNAGAVVSHPFGSIMRSIIVAVYELGAEEIFVIGHHECGMTGLNPTTVLDKARSRGVTQEMIDTLRHAGINLESFLTGFDFVQDSVINSVNTIRNHPLLPKKLPVHGLIMHPETGQLDLIADGYEAWTPTAQEAVVQYFSPRSERDFLLRNPYSGLFHSPALRPAPIPPSGSAHTPQSSAPALPAGRIPARRGPFPHTAPVSEVHHSSVSGLASASRQYCFDPTA
jgi:carbonic anhydrase